MPITIVFINTHSVKKLSNKLNLIMALSIALNFLTKL